jgi:hypothetical protein
LAVMVWEEQVHLNQAKIVNKHPRRKKNNQFVRMKNKF